MTIAVKVTVTKDASTGLLSAKTAMTSTGGEATGEDDKVFTYIRSWNSFNTCGKH